MPLNEEAIAKIVKVALREDAAYQDITTLTFIPDTAKVEARIIVKESGVISGIQVARQVFKTFDKTTTFGERKKDGQAVQKGDVVAVIVGKARSVLSCERVALNFFSHLSGISTATNLAVKKVRSQGIRILDTRKTTPLLRSLEKYAILMGGGKNHRLDLSDQYLVKDNHVSILKKTKSMDLLVSHDPKILFEIEVEDFAELKKVVSYRPDIIMLDNFSPAEIKKAIRFFETHFPKKTNRPLIELSGNITLKNISQYAIRGVDFISLGALTHSVKALDLSLEIIKVYNK